MKILPLTSFYAFVFLIGLLSSLLMSGCSPKTAEADAGDGDLAGFELTAIEGSNVQHAVRKDANGQVVFEGYVLDNKRTGEWLEYNTEGDIVLIENYVDGLREGISLKLTPRGQIDMRARYHRGLLHGPWKQYKFGKLIEERNYVRGNLEGVVKTYDDHSWKLKQEAQYREGKLHGYYRYYDDAGNVTLEYQYKNGEKLSGGMVGDTVK